MNPTDTVRVLRVVGAMCPAQRIDEHTPEAWHEVLGDLRVQDCLDAVRELGGREPFISPADVRAEVRRARAQRLARATPPEPPAGLGDDPAAYLAWQRATTRAIADGTYAPEPPPALTQRPALLRAAGVTPVGGQQGASDSPDAPSGYARRRRPTSEPQKAVQGSSEGVA